MDGELVAMIKSFQGNRTIWSHLSDLNDGIIKSKVKHFSQLISNFASPSRAEMGEAPVKLTISPVLIHLINDGKTKYWPLKPSTTAEISIFPKKGFVWKR